MDMVHAVFKTPRNHMLVKPISLWCEREEKLVNFDFLALKAFVTYYIERVNTGVRIELKLDLASMYGVTDNNANKMCVKTATAFYSKKHQRFLNHLLEWLLNKFKKEEDVMPFEVKGKSILVSDMRSMIEGFLAFAKVMDIGIDACNGEDSDAYGNKIVLRVNYQNCSGELNKLRSIPRYLEFIADKIKERKDLSLNVNYLPSTTVKAIGITCHGIATFIIYLTGFLAPSSSTNTRQFNGDKVEHTFAALKAGSTDFNMKCFMINLSIVSSTYLKKLMSSIESNYLPIKNKKRKNKFEAVTYVRHTNSTIESDSLGCADDDDKNNNDNTITDLFRVKNNARKVTGADHNYLNNDKTAANKFSRAAGTVKMVTKNTTL
jgi:hypothetical protein